MSFATCFRNMARVLERFLQRPQVSRGQLASRLGIVEVLEAKCCLAADVGADFADLFISSTAANPVDIELADKFGLSEVQGTLVRFKTNAANLETDSFFVELADHDGVMSRTTPVTVDNFLRYVRGGRYDNTIIHRSVKSPIEGDTIQGGGYTRPTLPAFDFPDPLASPQKMRVAASVSAEIGNPLAIGTLAMALEDEQGVFTTDPSNQPNTAASQWFVNTADNSQKLDGRYTAFGKVLGEGMAVVQAMAGAPTYLGDEYYLGLPLDYMPLWQLANSGANAGEVQPDDFVTIESIAVVGEAELLVFEASVSGSATVAVEVVAGKLRITPEAGAEGDVIVTVTARSTLDQTETSSSFAITLSPAVLELQVVDASGGTSLEQNGAGELFVDEGVPVRSRGGPITKVFASWEFFEAERVEGQNLLFGRHESGSVHRFRANEVWIVDAFHALGNSGNVLLPVGARGYPFEPVEPAVDLTRFASPVEVEGNVALRITDEGVLFAGDSSLTREGLPLRAQHVAGMRPLAAEFFDAATRVLWVDVHSGNYWVWEFDESGGFVADAGPVDGQSVSGVELLGQFGVEQ